MNRRSALLILLAVAGFLLAGRPSAAVETCDLDCLEKRLSGLRGKVVLVDFWATWCPPCKWEIPEIARLRERYRDLGFEVLGVSLDTRPDAVDRFLGKTPVPYPVVLGTRDVKRNYRVMALPTKILLDRSGAVVERREGYVEGEVLEEAVRRLLGSP